MKKKKFSLVSKFELKVSKGVESKFSKFVELKFSKFVEIKRISKSFER